MNKKTVLVLIGIGVLLYLWSKGYFSKKETTVVQLPVEATPKVASNPEFERIDAPTMPLNNDIFADQTQFDLTSDPSFHTKAMAAGTPRNFGLVRRPR
jgi:hypothetical protein